MSSAYPWAEEGACSADSDAQAVGSHIGIELVSFEKYKAFSPVTESPSVW